MSRESSSGSEDFSRTPHVSDSEISSDDAGELGARPYMFEPWRNKYYHGGRGTTYSSMFEPVRNQYESLDSGCVAHAMAVRTKPLRLGGDTINQVFWRVCVMHVILEEGFVIYQLRINVF